MVSCFFTLSGYKPLNDDDFRMWCANQSGLESTFPLKYEWVLINNYEILSEKIFFYFLFCIPIDGSKQIFVYRPLFVSNACLNLHHKLLTKKRDSSEKTREKLWNNIELQKIVCWRIDTKPPWENCYWLIDGNSDYSNGVNPKNRRGNLSNIKHFSALTNYL